MIRAIVRHKMLAPLIVLLVIGTIAGTMVGEREDSIETGPPLFSRDKRSGGALALAMWLEQLGYRVNRLEGTTAVPGSQVNLTFVLSPTRRFTRLEADGLTEWVESGGILVHVPRNVPGNDPTDPPGDGLVQHLGMDVKPGPLVRRAHVVTPLFNQLGGNELEVNSNDYLELNDDAWLPILRGDGRVIAATRSLGQGRIYASSSAAFFENERIGLGQNPELVLGILGAHPGVRTVAFDEYHHGVVAPPSLNAAARGSPWGWAIAYLAVVTFLFLLWAGRRFGPPVVPVPAIGRSTGDYVVSLAGLIQRARAHGWAQAQYARLVRRSLSRILGVRSDLPIPSLAQVLKGRRGVDSATLAEHLSVLEGPPIGERALLHRARDVERQLRTLQGLESG